MPRPPAPRLRARMPAVYRPFHAERTRPRPALFDGRDVSIFHCAERSFRMLEHGQSDVCGQGVAPARGPERRAGGHGARATWRAVPGLPAATAHRLLLVLRRRGFVRQEGEGGRYVLTLKLLDMSFRYLNGSELRLHAYPPLREYAGRTAGAGVRVAAGRRSHLRLGRPGRRGGDVHGVRQADAGALLAVLRRGAAAASQLRAAVRGRRRRPVAGRWSGGSATAARPTAIA